MPALADRENFETSIVGQLAPIFADQYERAAAAPSAELIPYGEFQAEMQAAMQSELAAVFQAAGAALLIGNALVFSQGAFEDTADQWAAGMAKELSDQVVETSRRMAADAWGLAAGANGQIDKQRLAEALALIFLAPSRLESIAITEVTRAVSAGEQAVILLFPTAERSQLVPVWRTEEDARVCPICRPFDGRGENVYGASSPGGPPAHPRCRCWLEWVEAIDAGRRAA